MSSRGKKRYGKGWAYGVPLELDINGMKVPAIVRGARKSTDGFVLDYDEVLPKTVGRDTGRKTKQRESVYSGDVILLKQGDGKPLTYLVEWSDITSSWICRSREHENFVTELGELFDFELKVIGNIHDNSQIMEAAK